jgi:hypothetical protein
MANGEWRIAVASAFWRSLLQCAYEQPKHLANGRAMFHRSLDAFFADQADPFGKQQVRLQLPQRSLRDTEILDESLGIFASMAFRDIGRDEGSGSPDL